jgi:hypothetical protein
MNQVTLAAPFENYPALCFVVGILATVFLYWCRSRNQILYGVIEIMTGIFLMSLSIQVTGDFSKDFSPGDFDIVRSTVTKTTYLGAIFVMVRGLDNIKPEHFVRFGARP